MCHPLFLGRSLGLLALAAATLGGRVRAQAAIDPNVAPRAAALEREGERRMAIDLLGRYLATAPDDGRAWFQLGRLYLYDARDWHRRGHLGDPDGPLYLDFAATALEQSARLAVDSGIVYGGLVDLERVMILVEDSGWSAASAAARPRRAAPPLPPYLLELGENLLSSCPAGGVLLTGGDLETVSAWYGGGARRESDVLLLRPDLYATDSLYRRRMAAMMGVDATLPVRGALAEAAARRALCLSPGADLAAAPALRWRALRLARVGGAAATAVPESTALSITELLRAARQDPSPWVRDVRAVYERAARYNDLLCRTLLLVGDAPPPACRR